LLDQIVTEGVVRALLRELEAGALIDTARGV
jgi:hypothetical protein